MIAGAFALAYVIVKPPSLDLAAHMFRAQLFGREPFGIWNNYWYSGHHIVGYSLLFPAASWALTPQLAAGLAATGTAALFEPLAYRRFGADAWLGASLFAAATATDLFTGRLAFAFGAAPAMAAVLALDRGRTTLAVACAFASALCSPVAALFAALAGGAYFVSGARRLPGAAVAVAALAPIGLIAIAFPEGGSEPFAFSAFWPVPLLAAGAFALLPRDSRTLRTGVVLYAALTLASYLIDSPIGSNAARLGTMMAAPVAALTLWPRRQTWLALAAAPALYLGWQAPVRDLVIASGDPSASAGYYHPLLSFLARQSGPPFRVEIPFTRFHWEAYVVALRFPSPRGWERQLDIKYNRLFYSGRLTAASYDGWLRRNAVRFVAAPDAPLDYAGKAEMRLITRGLPYLRLVDRTAHWRVYAVDGAAPIAQGAATLTAIGPDWLQLYGRAAGRTLVRVHFTPYWSLAAGSGCVAPTGDYTLLTTRAAGPVKLAISFALGRVQSRSARCR